MAHKWLTRRTAKQSPVVRKNICGHIFDWLATCELPSKHDEFSSVVVWDFFAAARLMMTDAGWTVGGLDGCVVSHQKRLCR